MFAEEGKKKSQLQDQANQASALTLVTQWPVPVVAELDGGDGVMLIFFLHPGLF